MFDVDFSDKDEVFYDLQRKYGAENVARIIAFGTLTPRAVTRKVLSFFEFSMSEIGEITKLIPELCPSMEEAYKASPKLLSYRDKHQEEFQIIERLEGTVSHESMHAGGIVIYENLSHYLPLKAIGDGRNECVACFDKYMLEALGFYKFDVLGLETLPMLKRTVTNIKQNKGIEIDLETIDYSEEVVYDMLSKGEVTGVFQLSNQAQKVMQQKPKDFLDLIAINALIRPGTGDWNEYIDRRNGKQYNIRAEREDYMNETEGLLTYQEQFLLDAKTYAGWDIAFSDANIRKNKDLRSDTKLRQKFYDDTVASGYSIEVAEEIWNDIEDAQGEYSFNKSHAASYAIMSYQTAWLKYHYPVEFYSALMSSEKTDGDGQSAVAGYIQECKKIGITIMPPDLNTGSNEFVPQGNSIRFRLTSITNFGDTAIRGLEKIRPIKSFEDLMERRSRSDIRNNVIESMIMAGCFDEFNEDRGKLLAYMHNVQLSKKQIENGEWLDTIQMTDIQIAELEKKALGVFLKNHPLESKYSKPLQEFEEGGKAVIWCIINEVKTFNDKNGKEMAFINVETLNGNVKVIAFKDTWAYISTKEFIKPNEIVMFIGKRSGKDLIVSDAEV